MSISKLLNQSQSFVKQYGATILTGVGSIGMIATIALAVKATPKALKRIEVAKDEKGEELTRIETIKIAGPTYIPTVLTGAGTLACIIGANVANKKQQASLMSAYALIDASYKEYKQKLKELYGEEAHENIVRTIAVEKAEDMNTGNCQLEICGDLSLESSTGEPVLFYDEYSKRYFESTIEKVLNAEYHFNRNLTLSGQVILNEFYELLGLKSTDYGSSIGWSIEESCTWIDFNHHKVTLEDGLECYIIEIIS